MPRVTILLSAWQAEAHLEYALASIVAQSYRGWRLLAVDDGSTDGTAALLDRWAARDERIQVISQQNRGLTPTLNTLISQVETEFWARHDADDVSDPARLECQLRHLDAHPHVDLLGCAGFAIDEEGARVGPLFTPHGAELQRTLPRRCGILHGSVLGRSWAVRRAAGYREGYRYAQDYDLWLRMQETGGVENLPAELYRFRVHQGQIGTLRGAAQRDCASFARLSAEWRRSGRPDPYPVLERAGSVEAALPELDAEACRRYFALRLSMAWERHAFDEVGQVAAEAERLTGSTWRAHDAGARIAAGLSPILPWLRRWKRSMPWVESP